jgi:hypothetical protein
LAHLDILNRPTWTTLLLDLFLLVSAAQT